MWKRNRKLFLLMIFFVLCFLIFHTIIKSVLSEGNIHDKLKGFLESVQFDFILDKLINVISSIFAALIAGSATMIGNAINLTKILSDIKKDKEAREPQVSISVNGVSTPRKGSKYDISEIVIGNASLFVYVYAIIENNGKCTIERISINNQPLDIHLLASGKNFDFHIKVCRHENSAFEDNYILILKYKDDKDIYYVKQYKLKIDERKLDAEVFLYKGQKKYKD